MSVRFDDKAKIFFLKTDNTEYQIKINEYGMVLHTYYGAETGETDMSYLIKEVDRGFSGNPYEGRKKRGISADTLPSEYSTDGAGDYRVNALGIVAADGSRTCDLRFKDYNIKSGKYKLEDLPYVREENDKSDTLEIVLEDKTLELEVVLRYGVFEKKDIITRQTLIINKSDNCITLNKASSMCMDMIDKNMDLIHFHGRHAMERQTERIKITHDIHTIGSKRGASSHHNNPFVIICDHNATEDFGNCYGIMLMYSGNHMQEVEMDQAGSIRIVSGIGSSLFNWKLGKSETFETPEVILAYSGKGLNELSFLYHRIIRENVCPKQFRDMKRPVLINNWEGTYFDFDEKKIIEIEDSAAELGCEMFVLDDGWFGERNDDNAGLGDWKVNTDKLPGGIKTIADHANSLGMKFGLWFEPEMINEDSDLYRNHPEWVITDNNRNPVMGRNQLLLDMGKPEVVDYLFDSISEILDSANIEYIKWDFNRSIANPYSGGLEAEYEGEVLHRFMLGTYKLMDKIRSKYPDILIEGCSGGGGRFDAGIMFYSPQIWCSDNSDAIDRLSIQKGTSYGYPVSVMGSHVSASPNHQNGRVVPIITRGIVAMSGTFGYELDPRKLSIEEKEIIKKQITDFNKYYKLIQKGRYYRLTNEFEEKNYVCWQFVSEDKSECLVNIVLTNVHANAEIITVKLKGLNKNGCYIIDNSSSSCNDMPLEASFESSGNCISYSGSALMNGGYSFDPMYGVYPGMQIHFKMR
ncbi:MAG: alpha-galactosidase [Butyrivibrio sp.]|nr:alpha-galactosidase [Butyrivibrio sp.]